MIDILDDDHCQLAVLCDALSGAPADRARAATDVFVAVLSRHLSAEEQYLYPTVRAVLPDGGPLADQELVEDAAMLHTLKRLPGDPELARVLHGQVRRHVHRAARELFPRLRAACAPNELIRLGNRVAIAQEAAPTRPHPGTPLTPPLNKVVEPAVAVLDKLRDALTGRPTRPEALDI
jgi:hypothetical protein